ncbi:PTS sugar transporter subunit IIA [Heyndrickxia acidiproducens]|uniref:PTS sugar transporter subunit IIA n=1 Tax=Heyndrickxia acidiproducens TaxID=1121084 RepID=UPI0003724F03|nr:PTS sugar transporter subunit IIA [Heyndrickxia acidiproducens]
MSELNQLFKQDLILFESVSTQRELFENVGAKLLEMGLVKPAYTNALIERESHYPTGLDLSVVGENTPNVAIPHTETEYCNAEQVVIVKLENEVPFYNMISPDKKLNVKFAFFILNHQKKAQTNILSSLMEFFTQDGNVSSLNQLNSKEEIFQFIQSKTIKRSALI